ncbi:MAG TPA: DUF885 family protein, partial [Acidimicrobiales bacterium]
MGQIDDIADRYVDEWAELSPIEATYAGIAGHDHTFDDLSPEGYAAKADLVRRTLAELATVPPADDAEHVARASMEERLGLWLDRYDAGDLTSEVNVITSALHDARGTFDLMPTEGEEAVGNIASRLGEIPRVVEQYQRTLLAAADAGHVSATAQMLEAARQFDTWVDPAGDDMFRKLAAGLPASGALRARLDEAAEAASAATADMARFLREELAPRG